jgi:rSAM/selenodomain-associated transferase 2
VGAALGVQVAEPAGGFGVAHDGPYASIRGALPGTLQVSIVVPTLDEEEALRRHLPEAREQADEVVVSDGGSRDATVQVARELGARIVEGPEGRGGQLHRGALAARGDVLLFLHADTSLPSGAVASVRRAVSEGAVGGAFLMRFREETEKPVLRLGGRLVRLRTRWLRIPLGDQAQFATRAAYEAVGGFPDWPILEDLYFIRRLRRHGRLAMVPLVVTTSGRRFVRRGVVPTLATNYLVWTLYALGVSPQRLSRLYRHFR